MIRYTVVDRLKCTMIFSLLLISLVLPVSASFVFQDVSITPDPPFEPGHLVTSSSQLVIVPQGGSTTFIGSNQLQLTTQLEAARWNVEVMVNGKPAAQIPVNGNMVFINGFLLSYPVSSDVVVSVHVNGTVPGTAGPNLNVVEAVQLNNAGQVVPGSLQLISGPLMVGVPSVPKAPVATPIPEQTSAIPTRTPGFPAAACVASLIICCIVFRISQCSRKT